MAKINKDMLLEWYRQIVLIRQFEETCDKLYSEKKITGVYMHLYSGQEATGVGALAALDERDHVITAYRDHGLAIARGIDLKPLMAEMMGKRNGVSGGKGGSMHLVSREHNFWGGYAIVGGHLPLSTGLGMAARYSDTDEVVVSFVGDGATNNGYFHEALNMSSIYDAPVIWIIENNRVGMGTRVEDAAGQPELHKRAVAYGMKEMGRVDGQNVMEVYDCVSEAVAYARENGPVLIESMTYRYRGHGVSDRSFDKRFEEELEQYRQNKDPITILGNHIRDKYKNVEDELEKLEKQAEEQVAEAVDYAMNSDDPTYEDLISNVYV